MQRVVIITGASSGIGLATAKYFLERGDKVYDFSRSDKGKCAIHIPVDVTKPETVSRAVREVVSAEGRIDVLVNNAGFGISGSIETTDENEAKRQFDVNFFGAHSCIRAVLPYMREQKSGTVINISSVGGVAALPFQAFYSASKSALISLTLALRNEVRPFGIRVSAVLPGDVRTNFTAAREKGKGDDAYGERTTRSIALMEADEQNGMSPDRIARKIYGLSVRRRPKALSSVGFAYKCICVALKVLPTGFANRIIGRIYSK